MLVDRFFSIHAEKSRDHRQWMETMRHHRRPSKWCSLRWPIHTNLMKWIAVHLKFFVLCTLFCLRNRLPHNGTSPLKAEFLIWLKGVKFCGVSFCALFFLRELIFADRGQSAKFAKIRTRKIFMLHSIANFLGYKLSTVRERHYNYHFKDSPVTCLHFLQRRFATSRLWHSWKSI